jgi:hypothetical protein
MDNHLRDLWTHRLPYKAILPHRISARKLLARRRATKCHIIPGISEVPPSSGLRIL